MKPAISLILVLGLAFPALAGGVHGVPLPRRAAPLGDGVYRSPRRFRDTVKFYRRFLAKRGNRHRAVPVYRYRGVTVARFLNELTGGTWSAIHVFIIDGTTQIFVVPGERALDGEVKPG